MSDPAPLKGLPGILRPFKEYVENTLAGRREQVVYYGVPGTCTPFIELLAYAIRGLGLEQVYVPYFNKDEAKKIILVEGVGMQVSPDHRDPAPAIQVIMGGLAMPGVPVTIDDAKRVLALHKDAAVIGVCFMNMFDKANWMREISFELLIDATINPVTVSFRTKKLSEQSRFLISSYDQMMKRDTR